LKVVTFDKQTEINNIT